MTTYLFSVVALLVCDPMYSGKRNNLVKLDPNSFLNLTEIHVWSILDKTKYILKQQVSDAKLESF